jgi:hypothetical protein
MTVGQRSDYEAGKRFAGQRLGAGIPPYLKQIRNAQYWMFVFQFEVGRWMFDVERSSFKLESEV